MALCEQAHVQRVLQISFANNPEPVVTYLIEGADQTIKTYLQQNVEEQSISGEVHDGDFGRSIIRLRERPVSAVSSVVENGVTLTEGDEYQWYPDGRVVRVSGDLVRRWQRGPKKISVDYTGGYAPGSIPLDIRNVCARMVARQFQAGVVFASTPDSAPGAVRSVSIDGSDSVEYAEPEGVALSELMTLSDDDMRSLSAYRQRLTL